MKKVMKIILVDAVYGLVIPKGDQFVIDADLHLLLEEFPNRKVIVTMANEEQMKSFGLDHAPYEVFTLKRNPEKSDPKHYEKLLQYLGVTAEDVVYFEHDIAAVKSAESVGIESYHYDSEKSDRVALRQFLKKSLGYE